MSDRRAAVLAAQNLLGVPAEADARQVTRAYRHGARLLHPDVNADEDAESHFLALQAAYRLSLQAARDRHELAPPPPEPCEHATPAAGSVEMPVAATVTVGTLRAQVRAGAPWLVAGPVQVYPARAPGRSADLRGER